MKTPELGLPTFNCPHCGALSQQIWSTLAATSLGALPVKHFDLERGSAIQYDTMSDAEKGRLSYGVTNTVPRTPINHLQSSTCSACGASAIWFYSRMIFPAEASAPKPSADLPETALKDYEEAATVFPYSPRAAAALLRLSLEKLCAYLLGKESGNINEMIGDFVKKGVSPQIVQAMDVLRVTGNNAVHPGTMDHIDDRGTALSLFGLVNLIVDVLITQPKHIEQMYAGLPQGARDQIEQRNTKALAAPRETSKPEQTRPKPQPPVIDGES